jgi:hypothetical protein
MEGRQNRSQAETDTPKVAPLAKRVSYSIRIYVMVRFVTLILDTTNIRKEPKIRQGPK